MTTFVFVACSFGGPGCKTVMGAANVFKMRRDVFTRCGLLDETAADTTPSCLTCDCVCDILCTARLTRDIICYDPALTSVLSYIVLSCFLTFVLYVLPLLRLI